MLPSKSRSQGTVVDVVLLEVLDEVVEVVWGVTVVDDVCGTVVEVDVDDVDDVEVEDVDDVEVDDVDEVDDDVDDDVDDGGG